MHSTTLTVAASHRLMTSFFAVTVAIGLNIVPPSHALHADAPSDLVQGRTCAAASALRSADYPVITPSNAAQVRPVASLGAGHLGKQIIWSPDGKTMVAVTSYGLALYQTDDFKRPPRLLPSKDLINAAALSPDGKILVGGDDAGNLTWWDTATGGVRATSVLLSSGSQGGSVRSVAYSPDGKTLAAAVVQANGYFGIKLLDTTTRAVTSTLPAPTSPTSVSFSPDSKTLAVAGMDGTIRLWNIASKKDAILYGHKDRVNAVVFSADNQYLASGSSDGTMRLWKVSGNWYPGGGHSVATMPSDSSGVAFSPDSQTLAYSNRDPSDKVATSGTIALLSVDSVNKVYLEVSTVLAGAQSLSKTQANGSVLIDSLAFSPDGHILAIGSLGQNMIRLVDVTDAENSYNYSVAQAYTTVSAVAFSPDQQMVASGSVDRTIRLSDPNGRSLTTLNGHTDKILSLAFSPDSNLLVSGSADNSAVIWDVGQGKALQSLYGHHKSVTSVAFSPDGKTVATGSADHSVMLWDTKTGSRLMTLTGTGIINSLVFTPDGTQLASGSDDGSVTVWNTATGNTSLTISGKDISATNQAVISLSFNNKGNVLASGYTDGMVRLSRTSDGQLIALLTGHTAGVSTLTFNPEDSLLASGSVDNTIRLWDVHNSQLVTTLYARITTLAVQFGDNGQTLIAVGAGNDHNVDTIIQRWNVSKSKPIAELVGIDMSGPYFIDELTFSPDSATLVSSGTDGRVIFWNIADGSVSQAISLPKFAQHLTFSPNGKLFAFTYRTGESNGYYVDPVIKIQNSTADSTTNKEALVYPITRVGDYVHFTGDSKTFYISIGNGLNKDGNRKDGYTIEQDDLDNHTLRTFYVPNTNIYPEFNSDGTRFASFSTDHSVIVWDALKDKVLKVWSPPDPYNNPNSYSNLSEYGLKFSPNGNLLALNTGGLIFLWNTSTGKVIRVEQDAGFIENIALSTDGRLLAASGDDTYLWDTATGRELARLPNASRTFALAFSPDGKFLVAEGNSSGICLYAVSNSQ